MFYCVSHVVHTSTHLAIHAEHEFKASHLNIQSSYQFLEPHLRQHEPFVLYFASNNLSVHELVGFYRCMGIHTTQLKAF